jgi:hypothetical protein
MRDRASMQRRYGRTPVGPTRSAASETEAPNMLVNLVQSGWAVVQSDNATEP